jgi:hypothetical protein
MNGAFPGVVAPLLPAMASQQSYPPDVEAFIKRDAHCSTQIRPGANNGPAAGWKRIGRGCSRDIRRSRLLSVH